jgi:hypothetical protein
VILHADGMEAYGLANYKLIFESETFMPRGNAVNKERAECFRNHCIGTRLVSASLIRGNLASEEATQGRKEDTSEGSSAQGQKGHHGNRRSMT